ncbi:hypothetical protein [Crocosphaera sp. Alani8]|uniref:hypothetical protein n=1 Tax=Crocosphaera sp. Alani8 TaxID=3038952 RepID=UPI00313C9FB2
MLSNVKEPKVIAAQRKKEQLLVATLIVLYVLQLVCTAPYLWTFVGLGSAYCLWQQNPKLKKYRKFVIWGLGIISLPILLSLWAEPSHAVLLTRVQAFLTSSFATGTDANYANVVNMIVNTMRGIYILFLVIAGWGAFQDVQQGQEMSGMARTMIVSLLGVFAIDVMSVVIVPGA